jgi:hypothetical protein
MLALIVLTVVASTAACKPVSVGGAVFDDATGAGIPGAIVTYTSVTSNVTFNDTSLDPSGGYSIVLPEDTYIMQVVHATCNNVDPPRQNTFRQVLSPYTENFFMTCP